MPGQLFSDAERRRLGGFPAQVSHEDLVTYYTLTRSDRAKVNQYPDDAGRLGFALQLGTLRYLGFCPDDLGAAPAEMVRFLAEQLKVPPEGLSAYGRRAQTRTDHFLAVQDHLGYRKAGPEERERLARWLLDRALEHDRPLLLWQLACEKLAADKLVRPGVTVLERMVVAARRGAGRETMKRLAAVLDEPGRSLLDRLLTPDESTDRTLLTWLRQGEVATTPTAILSALERRATLISWGVDRWDLRALHPNRLKFLARLGKRSTNQALQRAPAERRYPILVAFLRQALEETTDEVIDLFDRCLARASARAERKLEEFRLASARTTDDAVRLFGQIGRIVLDPTVADKQVRAAIYRQTTRETLREAVERTEALSRRGDAHGFGFLADRYNYLRQFTPQFLAAFAFRSNRAGEPILEAVASLRDLNTRRQRKLPPDAPVQFIPARWRPHVVGQDGEIDRHYYELCALWELRAALRAGNVWLETSRRFADPETYLISREQWPGIARTFAACSSSPRTGRPDRRNAGPSWRRNWLDSTGTGRRTSRCESRRVGWCSPRSRPRSCPRGASRCRRRSPSTSPESTWPTCSSRSIAGPTSPATSSTPAGGSPAARICGCTSTPRSWRRRATSARPRWPRSPSCRTAGSPGAPTGTCERTPCAQPLVRSSTSSTVSH